MKLESNNEWFPSQGLGKVVLPKVFSIKSAEYPSGNSNLDGLSLDIFFHGCTRHCPGCHNPELFEFDEPNKTWEDLHNTLEKADKAHVVTLLGGDPIDSMGTSLTIDLLIWLKNNFNVKTCIYTYRNIGRVHEGILKHLDYIKTGFYDETKRTPVGSFLSSENQIMWKKNETGGWFMQWVYNGRNNSTKSW